MVANRSRNYTKLSQLSALGVLGLTSALALARIFDGNGWLGIVVVAVVLPHVVGWFANRRDVGGVTTFVLWLLSGAYLTIVAVAGHETAYGFPTSGAITATLDMARQVPGVLDSGRTPADPSGAILLISLAAILYVNALSNWAATRRRSTIGAIGPQLALFIILNAFGRPAHTLTTTAYLLAVCVYALTEHQLALRENMHWFHSQRPRHSRLLAGGVAMSILVAVASVAIGPRLPTATSAGLFDYKGWGDGAGRGSVRIVSPLVNIGDYLNRTDNVELFTVESEVASYWRLVALDKFDGTVWGLAGTVAESGYPEVSDTASSHTLTQKFTIGPMGGPFLPAAYQAYETRYLSKKNSIHDSASLFLNSKNYEGLTYEVDSAILTPVPADLRYTGNPHLAQIDRYIELPSDFPTSIAELATEVTRGAVTPYENALALQEFFRTSGGFSYDTSIEGHGSNALENFVLRDKVGFCEQFAGAYAAMARSIGLPSRVAIGFTPGTLTSDGLYHVTSDNAHAWPEVYFEGIGWTSFEPTPGRYEPSRGDHTGTGAQNPGLPTTTTTTTTPGGTTSFSGTTTSSAPHPTAPNTTRPTTPAALKSTQQSTAMTAIIAIGYVLALLLVGVVVVIATTLSLAYLRRRRRFKARDARIRVNGAWAQAIEALSRGGIHRNAAATPTEFALRGGPAAGVGDAGPALLALAHLHTDALYSPHAPSDETADAAWVHVRTIEQVVAKSVRPTIRWRQRLGLVRRNRP